MVGVGSEFVFSERSLLGRRPLAVLGLSTNMHALALAAEHGQDFGGDLPIAAEPVGGACVELGPRTMSGSLKSVPGVSRRANSERAAREAPRIGLAPRYELGGQVACPRG